MWQRSALRTAAVGLSVVLAAATTELASAKPLTISANAFVEASTPKVIAYTSHWDQQRALAGLPQAVAGGLDEVSPSWYAPTSDGRLVTQAPQVNDDSRVIAQMRASGVRVVPAIANVRDGQWQTEEASKLLASPRARSRLIAATMAKVRQKGYDGIDLDFENGRAADRDNYVLLVGDMASALHAAGKTLSVTVHPKMSEPGAEPRHVAQDYARLGALADELRIMLYDYHWESSSPGPLAPLDWVRDVAAFTTDIVPAHKVVLGFATYGYAWPSSGVGEAQMYNQLAFTASNHDAEMTYEPVGGTRFSYGGHEVWLEDAVSLEAKLEVAREFRVGGVHLWRLGGEDPAIWSSGILKAA